MKRPALLVTFLAVAAMGIHTALWIAPLLAQSGDLSGRIAFVSLTTAQETQPGAPGKFAPNVLVRFTKEGGSSTFLTLTARDGTAFFPIEAGRYCGDAYGLNGKVARLSPRSTQEIHRCFTVVPGKVIEFSLTLAADATYGGSVPSLGVE